MIPLSSIIKHFQEHEQMLPMQSGNKFKFYELFFRLHRKNLLIIGVERKKNKKTF